jgi:type II secretory pathway component GspD/PulD (secretin)
MRPVAMRAPLPKHIAEMPIQVSFLSDHSATLGSLVTSLAAINLQVTFNWSNPTQSEDILKRKLPFLNFQGTVGELIDSLRNGMGIVGWYDNGQVYLSDKERYSLTLPQNEDVLKAVADEVKNLGGGDIVTSVRGGKLVYTASPTVQDELIGPFLARMSRNLSVVTMQVAVVSLSLTDNSTTGFDWDKFSLSFNNTASALTGSSTSSTSSSSSTTSSTASEVGTVAGLTSSALTLGKTSTGGVFGSFGAISIAGAVNFLSNFGHANITQNVQLQTLAGSKVSFQNGQEVPYVSGVNSSSSGYSSYGGSQTDKVETGLKVGLEPEFDADSQLVTIGVKVEQNSILQYVDLKVGNQLGTISQPLVQKQNLESLVRPQAGKTAVIGGLQYDSDNFSSSEPAALRKALEGTGKTTGSQSSKISRSALFIMIRPTVKIYEEAE